MNENALGEIPRSRTLIHPGRFRPVRIQSMHADRARHFRLTLEPGRTMFDALVQPLRAANVESASTTILGGFVDRLQYCVAPPDPTGQALIAYSEPISVGPSYIIFGNATLGKNSQGAPLVHCHAAICTEQGFVKGGHILTETCVIGRQGISVLVTSLDEFELRQAFDPETNIPLLQPHERSSHAQPESR